jgi:hypothetical protein
VVPDTVQVGKWELASPDRLLRFVAASAVFHVVAAPLTYWLWHRHVRAGRWEQGDALAWGLWGRLLVYLLVPYALGTAVGSRATGEGWSLRLWQRPDPPTDVDGATGEFRRDRAGRPLLRDERILVAWDAVE